MVLGRDRPELVFVQEADPLLQGDLLKRFSMYSETFMKLLGRLGRVHGVVQDGYVIPNDLFPVLRLWLTLEQSFKVLQPDSCSQNQSINAFLFHSERLSGDKQSLCKHGLAEDFLEVLVSAVFTRDFIIDATELIEKVSIIEVNRCEYLL